LNVVFLGFSTWQLLVPAAVSLLVLGMLLWMNHRTGPAGKPVLVLPLAGVLCPADLVARSPGMMQIRMPARAPPTSHSPSAFQPLDDPCSGGVLMEPVAILLSLSPPLY
jgi:hypothetical protein